jgi:hypothetical protein
MYSSTGSLLYELLWIESSNRKRVEEVREAKTKLEEQKAETIVKIQEVGLTIYFEKLLQNLTYLEAD